MKIWLDDIRPAPDESWTVALNMEEFSFLLFSGQRIEEISFDHDLGQYRKTGYDCLCMVERAVRQHGMPVPKMHVHTDNPSVWKKMDLTIKAIEEFGQARKV